MASFSEAIEEIHPEGHGFAFGFNDVVKNLFILTSVLFDYAPTYRQMIADLEAGTFGKVYTMTVQNEGVKLLELPEDVSQEVKDAVTKAQEEIIQGKIRVSAIGDAEGVRSKLEELGYR